MSASYASVSGAVPCDYNAKESGGAQTLMTGRKVELIYHMCRREEWEGALARGAYAGSSQDAADGFIHFSTAQQLPESARRHRAGQPGLVLLAVEAGVLGDALRWEASRRGLLFPHFYGKLPLSVVRWVRDVPCGSDGLHSLPPLE
jgi:uncharacterized protein (DUF952 family)